MDKLFRDCNGDISWLPLLFLLGSALLGYLLGRLFKRGGGNAEVDVDGAVSAAVADVENSWKAKWNNLQSEYNQYKLSAGSSNDSEVQSWKDKFTTLEAKYNSSASSLNTLEADLASKANAAAAAQAKLQDAEEKLQAANAKYQADSASWNAKLAAATGAPMVASSSASSSDDLLLAKLRADAEAAIDAANKAKQKQADAEKAKLETELRLKAVSEVASKAAAYEAQLNKLQSGGDAAANQVADLNQKNEALSRELNNTKTKLSDCEAKSNAAQLEWNSKLADAEAKLKAAQANVAPAAAAAAPTPAAAASTASGKSPIGFNYDDLKAVEGIGPKVEGLFNAKGINTWKQLAGCSKEQVADVLASGGERFRILNGNSWPKQAELLAGGKWDEFKAYTDYLIAGVDPAESQAGQLEEAKASAAAEAARIEEAKKGMPAGWKWDDLKIVEGIGPVIEGFLHEKGVKTWKALSEMEPDAIKGILMEQGERFRIHEPATWPQQAGLAHEGKWSELATLQDNLKGGRVQ
jgi:predicted flap endonuclease-1-like 5' DNA nuclease